MEPFCHRHRVTYAECTVGDHVYYGKYLELLEAARGEFFRALGVTFREWQSRDTIFPVVECRIRYAGPARYDDQIEIRLWCLEARGPRLDFGFEISRGDRTAIASGETRHVCTTVAGKAKRLPSELAVKLAPYTVADALQRPAPSAPAA